MLEAARGFGTLLKNGWKPRRTIIMCSWDGEEYGLLGSTEWAEENADELKEKAVAYLNVDSAVSGPNFGASSVPSMWKLIRAATQDIKDPKTGLTVYQQWQNRAREQMPDPELTNAEAGSDAAIAEARIGALGSGSDFTPFLQHLGIPSTDMSFNGDYGVYHSAYDSFYWMSHFGDPNFVYHPTIARLWGTIAMRLADAAVLTLDYRDYAQQVRDFFTESMKTAKRRKLDTSFERKRMDEAVDNFAAEAERVEKQRQEAVAEIQRARGDGISRSMTKLRRINDALIAVERAFTDSRGLRGRGWYTHQIYAPGTYTGYAAQPLPDFRQALDDRNGVNAKEALIRIVESIDRATNVLRKARD
jgi:N-acetylated-alpha-linked acidic dipeptidase